MIMKRIICIAFVLFLIAGYFVMRDSKESVAAHERSAGVAPTNSLRNADGVGKYLSSIAEAANTRARDSHAGAR